MREQHAYGSLSQTPCLLAVWNSRSGARCTPRLYKCVRSVARLGDPAAHTRALLRGGMRTGAWSHRSCAIRPHKWLPAAPGSLPAGRSLIKSLKKICGRYSVRTASAPRA